MAAARTKFHFRASLVSVSLSAAPLILMLRPFNRPISRTGGMDEVAYHALVNLLTPYAGDPLAAEALRAILAQKLDDSRVKSRIRVLLGDA